MTTSSLIQLSFKKNIFTITLNRPEKHNAFNEKMIAEFKNALKKIENNPTYQAVIINAKGKNFCAGADLDWMKRIATFTNEENKADALALADLLQTLNDLSKPTIALAHGYVIGGGIGLVACCDTVIATKDTQFNFSEVKLGLIPATIAPYVIRSIGYNNARHYFLTTEHFTAKKAKKMGLIHRIVNADELESSGQALAESITQNDPAALSATKKLLNNLFPISEAMISETAEFLAKIRTSETTQKRIQLFLKGKL